MQEIAKLDLIINNYSLLLELDKQRDIIPIEKYTKKYDTFFTSIAAVIKY